MLNEIELLKLEFQRQILSGKLSFSATDVLHILNHVSNISHKYDNDENVGTYKKLCKYHN